MKACGSCGELKPESEFYPKRGSCKECVKAQHKEYYRRTRSDRQKAIRKYYEAHSDEIKRYQSNYYQENKDAARKQIRGWREKNPDRNREISRKKDRKARMELSDSYVRKVLVLRGFDGEQASPLIPAARELIRLKRCIKEA